MTLAARALDFGFPRRVVGRGAQLQLEAGSVTCLLGPNGSGKTTLMRTLLGLLPPRGGAVVLDGRPIGEWSARARATRLAYVPQSAESHFDFTVREIAEMGRTAHGGVFSAPGRRDHEAALAALERVGIAALAERPIHRVSGGEQKLALVARALATEAAHLLMDEPTASLDFGNQARILDEIVRLRAAGAAVLFTSHHPDQALRVADRAILLRGGEVVASGPAAEVLDTAHLTALYGRPVEVVEVALSGGGRARACVMGDSFRID